MTLKSDVKSEEKLICCFKYDKNLVNFELSTENFYFDWFFLCKVYNFWPKKVQRSSLPWHWKVMQNLKKNWLVVWKMAWGNWKIFTKTSESLEIGTLMGSFYPKQETYELKTYRRVTCHNNEEWCKIWKGTDLSFQNWHKKFDEFWLEHSKVSKICTLMCSFWLGVIQKWHVTGCRGLGWWCQSGRPIFVFFIKKMDFRHEQRLCWAKQYIINKKSSFWLRRQTVNPSIHFIVYALNRTIARKVNLNVTWHGFVSVWFRSFTCTVRLLFHSFMFSSFANKTGWLQNEYQKCEYYK